MNPITVPMMVKQSHPVMTAVLLVLVFAAIAAVCYLLGRHHHHARKRKKAGHSPHTGHHGNH
jgi:hypothetical protein